VHDEHSSEWARLEMATGCCQEKPLPSTLAEFAARVKAGQAGGLYLFDWSMPLYCPELAKKFSIPIYFRHDYLRRTRPGSLYRDSWPSLFVAGSGAGGDLHVDAFASHFWMAMMAGRKRWTFFKRGRMALLRPQYVDSLDPVFGVDLDVAKKELRHAEVTLEAGELLFVPRDCPHAVANLTATVAVSGNFVDDTNVAAAVGHLRRNMLVDQRAADLLEQLLQLKLIP